MGEVGEAAGNFFNDALTIGTMGLVDAKKGRFYVPFSGASARAGARAIAGSNSDLFSAITGSPDKIKARREAINRAIDSPEGRIAGAAAATASSVGTGYFAGPAIGVSAGTGAFAGGVGAAGIAQADAMKQGVPNPNEVAPVSNESSAVQKAVAETASRRSRSRGFRSTILSRNFLSANHPALKPTLGS